MNPPPETLQIRHRPEVGALAFGVNRVGDAKALGEGEVPDFVRWPVPGAGTHALREELRWYLEEFLDYPFSPNTERADRALVALWAWGKSAYEALFGGGRAGVIYEQLAMKGLESLTLEVVSNDPAVLGWPWEALRDPAAGAAAIDLRVVRRLEAKVRDPVVVSKSLPKDRVHVLLVTARPYAEQDVPYRSISRRLFELVDKSGLPAEVTVLRPPTLDRLQEVLTERPDYYHVLHFDGHGGFGPADIPVEARPHQYTLQANVVGRLIFETEDGQPDPVDAQKLGALLREHRLPAVVMNACQSGMVDERVGDPFASVAAGLLQAGVRSVVAMSYSLYVSGAEVFLPAFYKALFQQGDFVAATRAGRKAMFQHPGRVCSRGRYALQDWLVPVLYVQEPLVFQFAKEAPPQVLPPPSGLPPQPVDAQSPHGLIGRDRALLALERALRRPVPGVLLSGLGGVGKTTLAWAFLEWLSQTGGLPQVVLWVDFREIRNAEYLLHLLGVPLFGETFRTASIEQKLAALNRAARQVPILWVWDNLEVAAGSPDSAVPGHLPEADQRVVARLLASLRGTQAHVLLTSRTEETWLGGPTTVYRMPLSGLQGEERQALAEVILQDVGVRPEQDDPSYADLLTWLDGHPLMMRVVLPGLQQRSSGALLEALKRDLGAVVGNGEAEQKLWAALGRVTDALPESERPLLFLLSLHERYVDVDYLTPMAEQVGPDWTRDRLERLLQSLAHAGLAQPQGQEIWRLHPALSTWLAQATLLSPDQQAPWRRAFTDVLGSLADALAPKPLHEQRFAFSLFEGSFRRALDHALALNMEDHVAALTQSLGAWEQNRGSWVAAERLYQRLAEHHEARGEEQRQAGALHQLGMVAEERRDFAAAEAWYKKALTISEKLGDAHSAASTYHQLGMVAQERRDFAAAEAWYKKALAIKEKLGNEHGAASTYHQLGMVAQERRDFAAAEAWYRKSLAIEEKLGNEHGATQTYHQLGNVALERRDFAAAEAWYKKALAIEEKLGNEHGAAQTYHQLGMVAQERRDFAAAEAWYKKALAIEEKLGNEHGAAQTYHQLGMVAQERRDFAAAEAWYKKALAIKEKLGNEHSAASTYHQLGIVAQERRDFAAAEAWYKKSLVFEEKLGNEHGAATTYGQLGVLAKLREHHVDAATWYLRALAGFFATNDEHLAQRTAQNYFFLLRDAPPALQPQLRRLWTDAGLPPLPDTPSTDLSAPRRRLWPLALLALAALLTLYLLLR